MVLCSCTAKNAMIENAGYLSDFQDSIINPIEYSPTTLIISYDPEIGKAYLLDAVESSGSELIYDYSIITAIAIRKPDSMTLEEAIEFFKKVKGVVLVEKDYIYHLD